ncbi:hypothetical protein BDA99DRAFT_543753 [Phascolomyces articulosus]|uniref:F-box domain-containing protein n=1 Tax=Phascolomyces articulosus TaxID=60185 RepID=A0AAD5P7W7_9FUNG|nr:hypothetical protein BDA99DRAFT_543753 [Phascolomyces articulosus]
MVKFISPNQHHHSGRGRGSTSTTKRVAKNKTSVPTLVITNHQQQQRHRRRHRPQQDHTTPRDGFHHRLPYDVVCQIFNNLELQDLLKCARVCSVWYQLLMEWPGFWRQLSVKMPQVDKPTFDKKTMRWRIQEFRVVGPMDVDLMRDTLTFLANSDNYYVQKLYFRKLSLKGDQDVNLLVRVLQSSPAVKRVEFVDCFFPKDKVFYPILTACSKLSHVSFSKTTLTPTTYGLKRPTKWMQLSSSSSMTIPENPASPIAFSHLTYLKLCFEQTELLHVATGQFSFGILRHCPNLIHLFLDSGGSTYQGHCIRQAIKHCPWLKNLVISDKAVMPTTVTSSIQDTEYHITTSNFFNKNNIYHAAPPKKGQLRRFVLTGGHVHFEREDIVSMYTKARRSLELLYLHYDGNRIGSTLLSKFAHHGTAHCLREIRLSTENMAMVSNSEPSTAKTLAAFLSQCPSLEVLKIIDTFNTRHSPTNYDYIYVDDQVLHTLADRCPLLRHLQVFGRRHYTVEGLLYFATKANHITYLEMDIDRKIILTLVEKIPTLQSLNIRKDQYYHEQPMSVDDKTAVKQILSDRGGMFTVVV